MHKYLLFLTLLVSSSAVTQPRLHWQRAGDARTLTDVLESNRGYLYAVGSGSIYRSVNYGASWDDIAADMFFDTIVHAVMNHNLGRLYVCTATGGYATSDSIAGWKYLTPLLQTEITDIATANSDLPFLYLTTRHRGFYQSQDEVGWNRQYIPAPTPAIDTFATVAFDNLGRLFLSAFLHSAIDGPYGGIFQSDDLGASWAVISTIHQLAGTPPCRFSTTSNDSIIHITSVTKGIFRQFPYDSIHFRRINQGLQFSAVYSSVVNDSTGTMYVGTIGGGVYKRKWGQDSAWINISDDLPTRNVTNVFIDHNNRLYACTVDSGLYRTKDPIINAVHEPVKHPNPTDFELAAAYPNPFNSEVTFTARISKLATIRVAIYDLTGKEVAVLATGNRQPGTYQFHWDAVNFASGTYICRLQAGEFTTTRKIVLAR